MLPSRRQSSIIILFALILILLALATGSTTAQQLTPTPASPTFTGAGSEAVFKSQLDEEEAAWNAQNITSYRLQGTYTSVWYSLQVSLVVADGRAVDLQASCSKGIAGGPQGFCQVSYIDPSEWTVPGLFKTARNIASLDDGLFSTIQLNTAHHYPASFAHNNPDLMDGYQGYGVAYFEPLSAAAAITNSALPLDDSAVHMSMTATALAHMTPVPITRTASPPTPTPTPSPEPLVPPSDADLVAWINEAEAAWTTQPIENYDLTVRTRGAWTGSLIRLTVRDGNVTHVWITCEAGAGSSGEPCWIEPLLPQREYTIVGLFGQARKAAAWPGHPMSFDPVYRFPVTIFFDDPALADEERVIQIVAFSPQ
jgi:hypothetical protein